MCIAIMNKKGITLKKSILKTCWENNTQGGGILWVEGGRLQTYKELSSFKKFMQKYNEIRLVNKDNIVLHFRIATHGGIDHLNCHPFLVNDKLGFVHNGVIRSIVGFSKEKSDTNLFCDFLKTLPKGWEHSEPMYKLIGGAIGSYNKLIFLNNKSEFTIVNEEEGVWDMGCWFSNTTYKDYGYADYGGTKVYTGSSAAVSGYSKYSGSGLTNISSYVAPTKKWWKEESEESFWESEKTDSYVTSDYCDCCLKEKKSKYNYNNMAHLCSDCETEWSAL